MNIILKQIRQFYLSTILSLCHVFWFFIIIDMNYYNLSFIVFLNVTCVFLIFLTFYGNEFDMELYCLNQIRKKRLHGY